MKLYARIAVWFARVATSTGIRTGRQRCAAGDHDWQSAGTVPRTRRDVYAQRCHRCGAYRSSLRPHVELPAEDDQEGSGSSEADSSESRGDHTAAIVRHRHTARAPPIWRTTARPPFVLRAFELVQDLVELALESVAVAGVEG